ncbi:MAG: hypothetical protein ACP5P4_16240, partial [Steroidobacteraceae bacterium]
GPETAQTVVWYLLACKSLLSDGNACCKAISITTKALAPSFFTPFHAFSGLVATTMRACCEPALDDWAWPIH